MENSNKKTTAENQKLNSQINASATKNNLLKWVVIENFEDKDFLMCAVYECGEYQYKVSIIKNESLKNVVCGQVIKSCIVEYNYISPDGFTICYENFESKEEAKQFLKQWIKSFERQGYYSSVKYGRIPLTELESFCEFDRKVIEEENEGEPNTHITAF